MTKIILINKNEIGDIRIAFLENGRLFNFEIDNVNNKQEKGNIYKGFITKIEIGLDALFIDYGVNKDGFLSFKELSKNYLDRFRLYDITDPLIHEYFLLGQSFIVQIEIEERSGKGASLTTYINLSGCYLVLMPYSSHLKGISKKISELERFALREILNNIIFFNDIGIIIRTFGYGRHLNDFKWELFILLSQLKFIKVLFNESIYSINMIYEHNNLLLRTIKDYLKYNISKIIMDDSNVFNLLYKYLSIIKSIYLNKLFLYSEFIPLFSKYEIEKQIELLFKREIFLLSGGSITIDCEEALTFIDVNSSKANKCDNVEETALQINLEALEEIVKQLIIRDLGGLIIIDFIDIDIDDFFLIEKKIKYLLSFDKAKIRMEKISKFGLLEMSRERIKSSFLDFDYFTCYKCSGTGKTLGIKMLCLKILYLLEEEIIKYNIYQINLELPINTLNYLTNVFKKKLYHIEKKYNIILILISNKYLYIPDYKIYCFKFTINNTTTNLNQLMINNLNCFNTLLKNNKKHSNLYTYNIINSIWIFIKEHNMPGGDLLSL